MKRRIFGVLMTVVVALAGFMAIACGGDKILKEGAESGVYYQNSEYGTEKLALDSGNKFTLVAFGNSKSGTYTLKGDALTLKFYYSADGKIDAKYAGNVITFTYNNTAFSLAKEVFFTVDFNSLGGSTIPSKIVMNNQLLDVPPSPTRDGYTFIGWYQEEALTNPFHFHATPITAGKTLFARWTQDPLAITEFTINFDFNFEGAQNPDAITTIGGKIFEPHLPSTPARTGYIFRAWFVSMTENANELSYKFSESLVFSQNTTLFAVWESTTVSSILKPPIVSVYNGVISWETVPNANNYTVAILNKTTGAEVAPTTNVGSNSRELPDLPIGEYKISVRANAAASVNNSPATERFIRVNALDRVSIFNVVDAFTLTFRPVKNAANYLINISCGNHSHITPVNNFNSTVFNFASCGMHEDGIKFTVTASAPGYLPSVSSVFTVLNNLDPIGEIVIDQSTQTASFSTVKNATSYLVTINSGEGEITFNNGLKTSVDLKEYTNGTNGISVTVTAHARGYNSTEEASDNFVKTTLPAPKNVRLHGSTILFDEVANAESYKVRIGTQTFTTETNQYLINVETLELELDTNYEVAVTALGNSQNLNSLESSPLIVRHSVALSSEIKYVDGVLSWIPLIGATAYVVHVNDTPYENIIDCYFAPTLNKAGENILKISIMGDTNYQTMTVNAYSISFESGLPNENIPTIYKALGDTVVMPMLTKENFVLEGWFTTPGGLGELFFATNAEKLLGEANMIYPHNITLYASFKGLPHNITVLAGDAKFNDGSTEKIIEIPFGEDFSIPFVPEITEEQGVAMFIGYYRVDITEVIENGKKKEVYEYVRVADERGYGLVKANFQDGDTIVARFSDKVLMYELDEATKSYYTVSRYNKFVLDENNNKIPRKDENGDIVYNEEGLIVYMLDYGDLDLLSHLVIPKYHPDGKQVKVINNINVDAFNPTDKLVSIFIPETIESVLREAFTGCSSLIDIIVDEKSTLYASINGALIETDPNDASVRTLIAFPFGRSGAYNVPYGVRVIADYAFSYSTKLTSITIPSTLSSINNNAFKGCSALKNIIFAPNGVLSNIGSIAFQDCTSLASVTIPPTVSKIGSRAFYNTAIQTLTFRGASQGKAAPLTIAEEAFALNKKLTTITFEAGSNVIEIGADCFFGGNPGGGIPASILHTVTIPNTVTTLGDGAFNTNPNLKNFAFQDGCSITEIPFKALYSTGIENLEIPNSVTKISESAFAFCKSLVSVSFQPTSQLLQIGNQAFEKCELLEQTKIPATVNEIGSNAFAECKALAKVEFETNSVLTKIGTAAFAYSGLTSIIIPKGVEELNAVSYESYGYTYYYPNTAVFYSCQNLLTVEFQANSKISLIQENTFDLCNSLQSITVHPSEFTEFETTNGILYKNNVIYRVPAGLPTFTIGKDVTELSSSVIDPLVKLEQFILEDGNTAFEVHDGVLYKKSGGNLILLRYPSGKEGATVTVPTSAGGKTVVSFDAKAFNQNGKIKHLIVPNAFKVVPANAFNGLMKAMETLTLEEGITEIGSNAFRSSPNLTTVNLPASLITIGNGAFNMCGLLETVNIAGGSKLERIDGNAFNQNRALKNINLPEGLKTLGESAFSYCTALTSLTLPSTLTTINNYVFSNCSALAGLIIPSSVTTLGDGVFTNCAALATVTLPSTLNAIGTSLFSGCSTLTTLTIPSTVKTIGDSAFAKCSALDNLIIPSSVTSIGNFTFSDCVTLNNLTIPSSVTSIGNSAFAGCKALTSVIIPSSVTKIGTSVFSGCVALASVTIPSSVTSISASLFYGCSTLASINIPSSVRTIGASAFSGCSGLTSIIIPSAVTAIAASAFYGCSGLTSFIIPSTITSIGASAFFGCSGLTSIIIPSSVRTIGASAFSGCSGLTSFIIPSTVTSIGAGILTNCHNLKSISFFPKGTLTENTAALTAVDNVTFFMTIATTDSQYDFEKFYGSNQAVFYNCSASADGTYVASFNKTDSTAIKQASKLTANSIPTRVGYTFAGWNTAADGSGTTYQITTSAQFTAIPNGTLLYSTWTPIPTA